MIRAGSGARRRNLAQRTRRDGTHGITGGMLSPVGLCRGARPSPLGMYLLTYTRSKWLFSECRGSVPPSARRPGPLRASVATTVSATRSTVRSRLQQGSRLGIADILESGSDLAPARSADGRPARRQMSSGRQMRPAPGSPAGCGSANGAPLHRPCGAGDRSGPLRTLQ
jgi:hypothetical protein